MNLRREVSMFGTLSISALVLMLLIVALQARQPVMVSSTVGASNCKQHLDLLRSSIREYITRNGAPPAAPYALRSGMGVSDDFKCPTCGGEYFYDPQKYPSRYIVCPYPEHLGF